jgi:succinate dehydrogenase / fumarate reductase cytochrome b subunit
LLGNLQLFAGQDAINSYAKFLKDLGPLLWIARIGLLTIFVLHIVLAILLKRRSARARPVPYRNPATIQASAASRTMLSTGLVILAFVLFHLAHFTFAWVAQVDAHPIGPGMKVRVSYLQLVDAQGRHDVYSMVVAGFKNPMVSMFYILAQLVIFVHLSHGISSTFQSLGLNTPRTQRFFKIFGWCVAGLIAAGNIAIVLAVWCGTIPEIKPLHFSGE